jgi:hypothetical protein
MVRGPDSTARARSAAWLVSACVVATLSVIGQWREVLIDDPAWYLYVASRVADGAVLYRDVVDPNPPLIIWLQLPLIWLARVIGANPVAVFRLVLAFGLCLSVAWGVAVVRPLLPPAKLAFLGALILFALPVIAYGEREHLILACMFPYLAVVVRRGLTRDKIPSAWAAALLAGIGLALKPQYGFVWIAAIVWLAFRRRHPWAVEQIILPLALALTLIGSIAMAPAFLAFLRDYGAVYWIYRRVSLAEAAFGGVWGWLAWGALALFFLVRRSLQGPALADLLAAVTLACIAGVIVQSKGFNYHWYPALGMTTALLTALLSTARPEAPRLFRFGTQTAALLLLGLIVLPRVFVTFGFALGPQTAKRAEEASLAGTLGSSVRGAGVLCLAARCGTAFRLVTDSGARWTLRHPYLWVLAAVPPDSPAGRLFIASIVEDIERAPPRVVLIAEPRSDAPLNSGMRLDYQKLFANVPEIRHLLDGMERLPNAAGYRIWRRRAPMAQGNVIDLHRGLGPGDT